MSPILCAVLPFVLLILLGVWGTVMNKTCKFKNPPEPWWPYAENPGVALELADSPKYVDDILGDAGTPDGKANRVTTIRLQKFDFVFIPLYVLFFSAAAVANGGWFVSRIVIGSAILTGLFDLRTLHDFKFNRVAVLQGAISFTHNCRVVHKHISFPIVTAYKTKALSIVKPFHLPEHCGNSFRAMTS